MSKVTDMWWPMFTGDYLRDTMHLTCEQHGAYHLLLHCQWQMGSFPNDDAQLASICKIDIDAWRSRIAPVVLPFFSVLKNGRLQQKRLQIEREKAQKRSVSRSQAGSAGGRAKAENAKNPPPPVATDVANHVADEQHEASKTLANALANDLANEQQKAVPSPSPSPIEEREESPPTPPRGGEVVRLPRRERIRSRIPVDWKPSEAGVAYATAHNARSDKTAVDGFRNHHIAHGSLMGDVVVSKPPHRPWLAHGKLGCRLANMVRQR